MKFALSAVVLLLSTLVHADKQYNFETALSLFQQQDYGSAFIHLRHVLHQEPDHLPAKLLLGDIFFQQGRFFEAIYVYEEALTEGADINLMLPSLLTSYQVSRHFNAILRLENQGGMQPQHRFRWLLSAAAVHGRDGNFDLAAEKLTTAAAIPRQDQVQLLNAKAALHLQQQNFAEVESLLAMAMDMDPKRADSWRLKGDLLRQQDDFPAATKAYQQAWQLAPDDPVIMRSLSAAFIAMAQLEEAKKLLDAMQQQGMLDPYIRFSSAFLAAMLRQDATALTSLQSLHDDLTALPSSHFDDQSEQLFLRASAGYLLGNTEQALRDFESYLQLAPKDLTALGMAADIYRRHRPRAQTLRFLEQHPASVQRSPQLLALQIQLMQQLGRNEAADQLLTQARGQYPGHEALILLESQRIARQQGAASASAFLGQMVSTASAPVLLQQTLLMLEQQDLEAANELSSELLKVEPSADNLSLLAAIRLKSGQWQDTQHLLNQLFGKQPEHFAGRLTQANLYFQQQDFEQAEALLQTMLQQQSRHLKTTTLLAATELQLGKADSAESRLNELLNRQYFRPAAELLSQHYLSQRQYEAALAIVQRALRQEFMAPDWLLLQAEIQTRLNQPNRANQTLGNLAKQPGLTADIWYQIGQRYLALNQPTEAKAVFRQLGATHPDVLLYQLELVKVLLQQDQLDTAQAYLTELSRQFEHSPDILRLQASIAQRQGTLIDAAKLLEQAITLDPNYRRAWAELYELARDDALAAQFSSLAERQLNKAADNFWLRRLYAEHAMNHADHSTAASLYQQLLEQGHYQQDPALLNNLAIAILAERPDQARVFAQQAVSITPMHPGRLTTYASTLIESQEYETALPLLRRAHSLDSGNVEVLYLTAVCLLGLERQEEAIRLLRQLSANDDHPGLADRAQKRLSALAQ